MKCQMCNTFFKNPGHFYGDGCGLHLCNRCLLIQSIKEKFRRLTMTNIKITAEVNGRQVPLETISTETFEAIKALEKPKEIPVARWATCSGEPRLLFRPTYDMELKVGTVYALDLKHGVKACEWTPKQDERLVASQYRRVTPQL